MSTFVRNGLALLIVLSLAVSVAAETQLEVSGQVRVRNEIDHKSFNPDHTTLNYQLMRTRVNVDATVDSNTHAFVQFQDSRMFGDANQFGVWQSGSLSNTRNVDIHQAYIQVDRIAIDGLGARAGRFEFNLGNQRVFGAVGWHNVGRAWEGMEAWYARPDYKVTAFVLRAEERNDEDFNRDYDIMGSVVDVKSLNLELLGVYENDDSRIGADVDRFTVGTYLKQRHNQLDFELNAAYQFGTIGDDFEIAAFMIAGEAGFTFDGSADARVALGIDYCSGDERPGDFSEINDYDNLYYTGHKFRGHMDYFLASNTEGLMDLMFRGSLNPAEGWVVATDVHYFKTAKDYRDPLEDVYTSDIGIEIDASVSTTRIKGITFDTGVSMFLPEESFVRINPGNSRLTESDPTFWVYNQATVNF